MVRRVGDNPEFERLLRRVGSLLVRAAPLREVVFRSSEPAYATKNELLTGAGSRRFGGRWNRPFSFASVYAAFSDATALAEAKANYLYYGLDPADALPRTLVAVEVGFTNVLNLTDGRVRKFLGVSGRRMRCDDWRVQNQRGWESLTQAIGRAAYHTDFEAIIVPACDGKANLVWFPGNLRRGSTVMIRNGERLR